MFGSKAPAAAEAVDDCGVGCQRPRRTAFSTVTLALAVCLLSACGVMYRPAPFWGAGGYSSTDIDATTVEVNYLTARSTDTGLIRDYALYRSAEIALERGFSGLVVLKAGAFSATVFGITTSATVRMQMFKGAPPNRSTLPPSVYGVYDALELKGSLERVIRR